jgi:hypothetical protein
MPVVKNEHTVNGQPITILIDVHEPQTDESVEQDVSSGVLGIPQPAEHILQTARDIFGEGLQLAQHCATRVVSSFNDMPDAVRPDEYEVQLAIRLDTELGAVLAKMGTEAQLQVSLRWTRSENL